MHPVVPLWRRSTCLRAAAGPLTAPRRAKTPPASKRCHVPPSAPSSRLHSARAAAMTVPLVAAKQQLRSLMKQRLSGLSQDAVIAQSRSIYDALQDFKPYREATRISIFLSMPTGEVQTDAIVRHALSCGKQVFVPYLHKPSVDAPDAPARLMDMVSLASIHDYETLRPDRWGIPSVDPATVEHRRRVLGGSSELLALDLMLLPGVAFDSDDAGRIRRLGHGKGFYDFFLNRYLAVADGRPPPLLYGLALTEQLLSPSSGEQVPVDVHDRNLHGLILGSGQLRESSSAAREAPP